MLLCVVGVSDFLHWCMRLLRHHFKSVSIENQVLLNKALLSDYARTVLYAGSELVWLYRVLYLPYLISSTTRKNELNRSAANATQRITFFELSN